MHLQDELDSYKEQSRRKVPPDALAAMLDATETLRRSGILDRVLPAGAVAPSFELPNQFGHPVRSRDLLARGPLIVSFYRGAWCPYCNIELSWLQKIVPEIARLGATLVAISPQQIEHSRRIAERRQLTFDLLSDPGNRLASAFGMTFALPAELRAVYLGLGIDLPGYNGDPSWTLPIPGRFVVDRTGRIADSSADPDYTIRPDPHGILDSLQQLRPQHRSRPINFAEKLARFDDRWAPKTIAQLNDYQFKLVKIQGEFVWHSHADTDEAFIVLEGNMVIELRDERIELSAGEMFVVPRGLEHRPIAQHECKLMLVEPSGTPNTGETGGPMTAAQDLWI